MVRGERLSVPPPTRTATSYNSTDAKRTPFFSAYERRGRAASAPRGRFFNAFRFRQYCVCRRLNWYTDVIVSGAYILYVCDCIVHDVVGDHNVRNQRSGLGEDGESWYAVVVRRHSHRFEEINTEHGKNTGKRASNFAALSIVRFHVMIGRPNYFLNWGTVNDTQILYFFTNHMI